MNTHTHTHMRMRTHTRTRTHTHTHAHTHTHTHLSTEARREDENVVRFQVSVDDVLLVQIGQSTGNLASKGMLKSQREGL